MKKLSLFTNDQGFFLPFVAVASIVLIMIVITTIKTYEIELHATDIMLEQVVHETIVQMSIAQFKQDNMYNNNENGNITYTFPQGSAKVQYRNYPEKYSKLTVEVTTEKGHTFYTNVLVTWNESANYD